MQFELEINKTVKGVVLISILAMIFVTSALADW